jgi:hypothetical protein
MQLNENIDKGHQHWLRSIAGEVLSISHSQIQLERRPQLDYQSNLLYDAFGDGQHLILKEFLKPEEFDESPGREYDALNLLSGHDIAPQPRAYYPHQQDNKPVVIYDYLDGKMWDRYQPNPAELLLLAQTWIEMSSINREVLWLSRGQEISVEKIWNQISILIQTYRDWVDSDFRLANPAIKLVIGIFNIRKSAVAELSKGKVPLCFCRADPRFANVIKRPSGKLGWVDWEDSGLRDPAKDLADIVNHPNQEDLLSPEQWRSFLDPYLDYRRRFDSDVDRRYHLFSGIYPVWWLAILLNEGLRQIDSGTYKDWRIHGINPNEKLRRYLARACAWPRQEFDQELDDIALLIFFPD